MRLKGGLIAIILVSVILYFADWGFYMGLMGEPTDMKAAFGDLMYSMDNMPNPLWFLVMEICFVSAIALAVFQRTMSGSSAALYGFLIAACIMGCIDIGWGMAINYPWPVGALIGELLYKSAMGAVAGWLLILIASKIK